jgi:hypothetical protein
MNVLNCTDKVQFLDLLKGSTSLEEVGRGYGKNKPSMRSTGLPAVHLEHALFFLHGGLLQAIGPPIPRVYWTKPHLS